MEHSPRARRVAWIALVACAVVGLLFGLGGPGRVQLTFWIPWLVILAAVLWEIASPSALLPHPEACELGADGVQTARTFIPWSDVTYVVHEGHLVEIGRSAGRSNHLHLAHPQSFVRDARGRLERARLPVDDATPTRRGYRVAAQDTERALVRVVLDGDAHLDERESAFARLPREDRELLLESVADRRLRDRLGSASRG